jgi:hypothetical protein
MRRITIVFMALLVTASQAQARTFGCFAGVLGASTSQSLEIVYNNHDIFYHKKHTTDLLPFLGCGVSFDF